jgi:hypothetical protein
VFVQRKLRVVKRFANLPILGICERCNAQFSVHPDGQVTEGQPTIENQFDAHKCTPPDTSQNALRIVREATEDK